MGEQGKYFLVEVLLLSSNRTTDMVNSYMAVLYLFSPYGHFKQTINDHY